MTVEHDLMRSDDLKVPCSGTMRHTTLAVRVLLVVQSLVNMLRLKEKDDQ